MSFESLESVQGSPSQAIRQLGEGAGQPASLAWGVQGSWASRDCRACTLFHPHGTSASFYFPWVNSELLLELSYSLISVRWNTKSVTGWRPVQCNCPSIGFHVCLSWGAPTLTPWPQCWALLGLLVEPLKWEKWWLMQTILGPPVRKARWLPSMNKQPNAWAFFFSPLTPVHQRSDLRPREHFPWRQRVVGFLPCWAVGLPQSFRDRGQWRKEAESTWPSCTHRGVRRKRERFWAGNILVEE